MGVVDCHQIWLSTLRGSKRCFICWFSALINTGGAQNADKVRLRNVAAIDTRVQSSPAILGAILVPLLRWRQPQAVTAKKAIGKKYSEVMKLRICVVRTLHVWKRDWNRF